MENKNFLKSIYLPLIIALAIIVGIVADRVIIGSSNNQYMSFNKTGKYDKLNSLLNIIDQNYVDKITNDRLTEIVIPNLLEKLDPHSVYITKEEMVGVAESMTGKFEGIGVQFNIQKDTVLIVSTITGGPSEKAGIMPGDRIVSVNDTVFAGTGITNQDVFKKLKGHKGSKVKIGILRRGTDKILYFDITRDTIPFFSVDASIMIDNEIGYIKINRFSGTTYSEFMEAAVKLKQAGMTKMILDLRQNGGGYLQSAVDILDEFLEKDKLIVYTYGNARAKTEYFSTDKGICKDIELEILIDPWSASATEIIAGAIQDNDRGIIIGQRSFGKGLVQEEFKFPDNSGFRLTIARYYTPSGRCIQKPYENGKDDYYKDLMNRAVHGEMVNKDSAQIKESEKYYTTEGRIVYGGGGIMPDIYVPNDTSDYTEFLGNATNKGYIYQFAVEYSDKNRKKLTQFDDAKKLNEFLKSSNILSQFKTFAETKKLYASPQEIKISGKFIENRLIAYIARNIMGENAFYYIAKDTDNTILEAIKNFKK